MILNSDTPGKPNSELGRVLSLRVKPPRNKIPQDPIHGLNGLERASGDTSKFLSLQWLSADKNHGYVNNFPFSDGQG
jgi:hypothetical protein